VTIDNNKRIVKNTLFLYFRMILILAVSLYTVRVILETLGVVDYGIFNVVGGIVTMFAFLSGTMASASQRFFAFELGRKDNDRLKKIFSITIVIYLVLGIIIFILAETIGLWFLYTQMTIPESRIDAALWVYQFSIFSFMMTMLTVPYNASIIAHERMNVYAYISIVEVILKLLVVFLLVFLSFDKLKLYAILTFSVTTLITLIYRIYCLKKFEECRFSFYWDTDLFKEIVSYSSWNLFGSLAAVFKNQGINILLNIFFDPIVNAARGIAFQVNNSINQFVINFSTAVNPQITKYYAVGQKEKMIRLVFQSSKLSYFLLFIISMPVLSETEFILSLWLKEVPTHTVLFTRLIIINTLIDSISMPLVTSALASGKIKKYQVIVGGVMMLNIPVSYIFLYFGYPPQVTMYVSIIIAIINLISRLLMLKNMILFPIKGFIFKVISRILFSSIVAYILPFCLIFYMQDGLERFIIVFIIGIITTTISIYLLGLSNNEKELIKSILYSKLKKIYIKK